MLIRYQSGRHRNALHAHRVPAVCLARKVSTLYPPTYCTYQPTHLLCHRLDTEMLDSRHAAVPFAVFADFGEC